MFKIFVTILIVITMARVLFFWHKGQEGKKVVEYVMPLHKTYVVQSELDSTAQVLLSGYIGFSQATFENIPNIDSLIGIHDSLETVMESYSEPPLQPEILRLYRNALIENSTSSAESLKKLHLLLRDQVSFQAKIDESRVQEVLQESAAMKAKVDQIMLEISVDYPIVAGALQGMKMKEIREILKSM